MSFVQRTVRLPLDATAEQAAIRERTRAEYAAAFDAVAEAGWTARRLNGVELHHATYRGLRDRLALPSQLVISARMKAVEALKAARALARQGRQVSRPSMRRLSIRFDQRSYRLDWAALTVRLTVVGGRIELPIRLSEYAAQFRFLPTASADLVSRDGRWFLHVVVTTEVQDAVPSGTTVGVDRGIRRPAATSAGRFLGSPRWRAIEERLLSLRSRLQAKGTPSARRHLRRLGRRLARFRRDCDHVLSKRLVASMKPGDTLVLETLTHIRDRTKARHGPCRRRLHAWSFRRLGDLLAYKAALHGVVVAYVDPRDSSRRCPACGHVDAANRRRQARFRCVRCGFDRNADLVAAWNLRDRHEGLWAPEPAVPGPVNGPNVDRAHRRSFCKPRTSVRGS